MTELDEEMVYDALALAYHQAKSKAAKDAVTDAVIRIASGRIARVGNKAELAAIGDQLAGRAEKVNARLAKEIGEAVMRSGS